MKQINIGLIGCGNWGKYILRDLKFLGCKVSVVESSLEGCLHAREYKADAIVSTIDDLKDIDGAIIAVPITNHAKMIDILLQQNIPIFVEKPMTCERESARRIAEQAQNRLFVMDKWRYHPGIELLGKIARSGELGNIIGLKTTRKDWVQTRKDVDGIWTLAPHDLSIALEILGFIPNPQHAIAEIIGGKATSIIGILGKSPWLHIDVSTRSHQRVREVVLCCEKGIAVFNDTHHDHIKIFWSHNNGNQSIISPRIEIRPISLDMPLVLELKAFLNYIQGGPPPRSSAAEGAMIVDCISTLREYAGIDHTSAIK